VCHEASRAADLDVRHDIVVITYRQVIDNATAFAVVIRA
jgi:hypothetical protein